MSDRPRICIIGPMLGTRRGRVTSQGEILGDLFVREGWQVRRASSVVSRVPRLVDMLAALVRWRNEIDVVIVLVFSGPSFRVAEATAWLARRLGKPVVLHLHGGDLPSLASDDPARVRKLLASADRVVAPSAYLRDGLAVAGVPIDVIPNALELDRYPWRLRAPARPSLLWMRAFHPLYRPDMAVEVLDLVRHRHGVDATLTMAGQDGPSTAATAELAERLGVGAAVSFAGFLDEAGKRDALDRHDVFVNTTKVDNTPVSCLEAAASGLVVVATSVGGIPALFSDGDDAVLVPDGDRASMAEAVVRVLRDDALVARLSHGGRALAERSAWPAVHAAWEALLRDVTSMTIS